MRIVRNVYSWTKQRCTAIDFQYHSLGRLYFVLRWAVFFFVLILFTGGWYDDFYKECKSGQFSGFTMGLVIFSGIVAFADIRSKIKGKSERAYDEGL
jgi:hypothetical protein